ncbi:DUF6928 family protein [Streptacidiphilus rugosus]|uniref:DUF6928 family protein n=1 Tax=Streptacidiphilus rugosus TaxID=405783 RepID=UPI00068DAB54|nr:hypothetical protein [Streptacidiphilus rugosus]
MGAKTGLLVFVDGDVPAALKQVGDADPERTSAMMRRLYPGWTVEPIAGSTLSDGVYPPDGQAYAGSWPGVELVCDRRVMVDLPSQLPEELVAAGAGRRMVLHAMHSVVDWLAFAVWEDGQLVRSLSVSPDSGILENIGEPLPFEAPYWAGELPADVIPWPDEDEDDEEPYPLPFHPLELGEDALRALCGFIVEGRPEPDDVDADAVPLHGFAVRDPDAPDPAVQEAAIRAAVAAMPPPRIYTLGPDGTLTRREENPSSPSQDGV